MSHVRMMHTPQALIIAELVLEFEYETAEKRGDDSSWLADIAAAKAIINRMRQTPPDVEPVAVRAEWGRERSSRTTDRRYRKDSATLRDRRAEWWKKIDKLQV